MRRFAVAMLLCSVGFPVRAEEESVPQEDPLLKQADADVEGTWQRKIRNVNGRELTVTKIEQGGTSRVTVTDSEGKILHAHHSQYELQRTGKVRIFKYWNRTVTAGPETGQVNQEPRSYIYRVVGDRFYEIHGILTEDDNPPVIFTWQRAKVTDEITSTSLQSR